MMKSEKKARDFDVWDTVVRIKQSVPWARTMQKELGALNSALCDALLQGHKEGHLAQALYQCDDLNTLWRRSLHHAADTDCHRTVTAVLFENYLVAVATRLADV